MGTLAVPRKHHEKRDSVKTKRAEHLDHLAPQNRPRAQKPSICSVFQHYQTSKPSKLGQAIGAHLTEEHDAMRPLGERIAALARAAESTGFADADWEEFRRLGREFIERMLVHVQKEEMALLPLLEEAMDGEMEARLYDEYAADG